MACMCASPTLCEMIDLTRFSWPQSAACVTMCVCVCFFSAFSLHAPHAPLLCPSNASTKNKQTNRQKSCVSKRVILFFHNTVNREIFVLKTFHAIIFRVKIFSYTSRPYENILTTTFFYNENLEYNVTRT